MEQLLFYGPVSDFTVASFMTSMRNIGDMGMGVDIKMNTMGGNPVAGWGMVTAYRDFPNEKKTTVHGEASSWGAIFLLFVDNSSGIEQSSYTFHRAMHPLENLDEGIKRQVDQINKEVRTAFEAKIDTEAFLEVFAEQHPEEEATIDRLFDSSKAQIDVFLNAQQAKAVRLIKKVVNLTVDQAADINENMIAASTGKELKLIEVEGSVPRKEQSSKQKKTNKKMTLQELKAQHPGLVAEIENDAAKTAKLEAIKAEKDRTLAWLVFGETDYKAVKEGIESGENISQAKQSEFFLAASKKNFMADAEKKDDNPDTDDPANDGKGGAGDAEAEAAKQKQKEIDDFAASVEKRFE